MLRQHNILLTGKYPKLEHVFSSKKHIIFRSYERQTMQTHLTKRMIVKDERLFLYYKHHINSNILPYLIKQKGDKQASLLCVRPAEGEVMIQAKTVEEYSDEDFDEAESENVVNEVDGNTMFLSKSMIYGSSLRQMVLSKDPRLDEEFCVDLVGSIVDFILGSGGVKDLMITSENIIFEDSGFFHLNYFSMLGLEFTKLDKYITKAQFEQMLPFLTSKFIQKNNSKDESISLLMQLRFIMFNFFSAFLKKDIIFDSKYIDLNVEVKRTDQKVPNMVKTLETDLLPRLMTQEDEEEVKKFDKKFQLNYLELLKQATNFQQIKQAKMILNWDYILSKLSKNGSNLEEMGKQENVPEHGKGNEDKQQQGSKVNLDQINETSKLQFEFYIIDKNEERFCVDLFEAVDVYITLMEFVSREIESQDEMEMKEAKIVYKNRIAGLGREKDNILKTSSSLWMQRLQFIQQERYTKLVYIPVKANMKFVQILKYKSWINMLNVATSASKSTLEAVTKLLDFVLSIRENIVLIQQFITDQLIIRVLNERKKQPKQKNRTFYDFLELIAFGPIQQGNTINVNMPNLKDEFWMTFFWVLNGLLMLIKRFLLRVTKHKVTQNFQLSRHEYMSIVQMIEEYTPALSRQQQMSK